MKIFEENELKKLYRAPKDSHKGQNGRLLVIGGSELFHASIFWSADIASKIVDLVHFTSPASENNDLVRYKMKQGFWNGIVVEWSRVEDYIAEDDCVLIGPGMPRSEGLNEGERSTKEIVNELLGKFPNKKWVVDGGALQEVDPKLLNGKMIVTPHKREWERLSGKSGAGAEELVEFSKSHGGVTVLLKGVGDMVCRGDKCVRVEGGNEGMTKGGTGDVLAGLVAALYCKNESLLAVTAGSYVTKKAGDRLYEKVGSSFNASDLVEEVARVMGEVLE